VLLLAPRVGRAQVQTVQVTVPAGVSFAVSNIANATPGAPATTTITFTGGTWPPPSGKRFRILVRADAASFTPPSGGAIPANAVSWTAAASTGTPSNGTLSSATDQLVFRSLPNTPSGSVSLTWQLGALTSVAGLRSGTHTLTARWRVELQ
jgi:hypothetical protein